MTRETARAEIKKVISCLEYLQPAANHNGNNGYCCPYCHSGHDGAPGHTGAIEYYPETNTFYCHACYKSGDVIDLYEEQTGCDYNEALTTLAARAGVTIDSRPQATHNREEERKTSPQSDENRNNDKQTTNDNKHGENAKQAADFTEYYAACAKRLTDPAAISYLQARGISEQTARAFNIGYDPNADPAGAPGAGIDEYKAHPTPRIIIPCSYDFYIARSIDPDTPKQYKAPNPKGSSTKLFNSAALYGRDPIFVVEGVFDALSFIEAGQQAIALNGKGNGKLLLQELQKQHPEHKQFIICPDNDSDPKTDADTKQRAAELNEALLQAGHKSIIYNVAGSSHDINDALLEDATTFIYNSEKALKELQRDELDAFFDKAQTEAYKPHKTGEAFFDNLLSGGIISQTLLLLMAAPSAGKTTLCQQLAEKMAENKTQVIYCSLEMSAEQMLAKSISARYYRGNGGDMSTTDVLQGYKWTDKDRAGITRTINEYRRDVYPYIKYNPAGVSTDLNKLLAYLDAAGAAAQEAGKDAPAVIIDYLQLLKSSDDIDTQELTKRAVEGLKKYAVKYNTFVIAIIATNRESNKSGRLTMESGRDSSGLEYTADYQISLNYVDIDNKKVNAADVDKVEELKRENPRRMILRGLKSRLTEIRAAERVDFDAKHNIFYGTCREFEDAPNAGSF